MSVGGSVDLLPPLTARALQFLAAFSRFHTTHALVQRQTELVWARYEAMMAMRDYLALLLAHDLVAISKAMDFGWRQRAIAFLRRGNRRERLPQQWAADNSSSSSGFTPEGSGSSHYSHDKDDAFTRFHCLWSRDLCEKCFALRPTVNEHVGAANSEPRECRSCGHRHLERSTACKLVPIASATASGSNNSVERGLGAARWVCASERCDFLVANAFLHALAPASSANRSELRADELWTAALAHAQSPVAWLYTRERIATSDELLQRSSSLPLNDPTIPEAVAATLELFADVLIAQLARIDRPVQ